MNIEVAQLVVGAAILDRRYRHLVLTDPRRAALEATQQAGAPEGIGLTDDDRQALGAINARTLAEFARGIERLRLLTPVQATLPASAGDRLNELAS